MALSARTERGVALVREGATYKAAAALLGLSDNHLGAVCRRAGVISPYRRNGSLKAAQLRARQEAREKLAIRDARIVAEYAAGVPLKVIAWKYQVSDSVPSLLARRAGLPARKGGAARPNKRVPDA